MGLKEDKAERNRDAESVCVSDREEKDGGREKGREKEREGESCLGSGKCPCSISRQLHLYNKLPFSGYVY